MVEPLKKTSIELPLSIWKAAKVCAVEEETDLRTVIIRALTEYLKTSQERKRGRRPEQD